MKASGLDFFASRKVLERTRNWDELIRSVDEIDGLFVVGNQFLRYQVDLHKFKRIIVPHPDSASIRFYADLSGKPKISNNIRDATREAKHHSVRVKWIDEYIGYSILVINKDKKDARVHIEMAIGSIKDGDRPSITIWKYRFESTFNEFRRMFDLLWEKAIDPPSEDKK